MSFPLRTYTPNQSDPLFVRFVNGDAGALQIIKGLHVATGDEETKKLTQELLEYNEQQFDLGGFRSDFKNLLKDIITNGMQLPARQYLNSYMEPSILEVATEDAGLSMGTTNKWLKIRNKEAPWIEAVVCYNLSMFILTMGYQKIKFCKGCNRVYIIQKFQYKYCSEACKKRNEP